MFISDERGGSSRARVEEPRGYFPFFLTGIFCFIAVFYRPSNAAQGRLCTNIRYLSVIIMYRYQVNRFGDRIHETRYFEFGVVLVISISGTSCLVSTTGNGFFRFFTRLSVASWYCFRYFASLCSGWWSREWSFCCVYQARWHLIGVRRLLRCI